MNDRVASRCDAGELKLSVSVAGGGSFAARAHWVQFQVGVAHCLLVVPVR
jgi:hypothetical protein